MTDVATAEMLWQRAHEHMRRSDFANAVRDLANCFQILQALGDPRVYEVHKRWTEVHALYLEDGQRQAEPPQEKAPTLEAEAESAANSGDLEKAIALYEQISAKSPQNELVKERLSELRAAKKRAAELSSPPRTTPAPTTSENDWSDVSVEDAVAPTPEAKPETKPETKPEATPAAAPAMAPEDAPVGMQSLDVPFSVGEAIDSFAADELPVVGNTSAPPQKSEPQPEVPLSATDERWGTSVGAPDQRISATDERWGAAEPPKASKPGSNGVGDHAKQIAMLEDMLKRIDRNRRKSA